MTHYVLLKLAPDSDRDAAERRVRKTYQELDETLSFLHNPRVYRSCVERDSNAEIMAVIDLDEPEKLQDYLTHPLHVQMARDLKDAVIYYVGPTPARPGQVIGSAGPTTSSRMDPYVPKMMENGMIGMIGKGRRSEKVKEAVVRHKGFYLVAAGGAGALLSHSIIKREPVAFEDLLSEAVTRITVKDFPCFVGIDCRGDDIYDLKEDDE